jgi:hypothetical protein
MLIDRFRQSAEDRLRYSISMNRWLAAGERITQVRRADTLVDSFITDEILVAPTDGRSFTFFASGGRPGVVVPVRFLVDTNRDQTKTITVEFALDWPRGLPMLPPGTTPTPPSPNDNLNLDAGEFGPGNNTGNCPS